MKNRFKEFVFEDDDGVQFFTKAKKGEIFEISEGEEGELIVRAISLKPNGIPPEISAGEYANVLSFYKDGNGNVAVIPPGWTVSGVKSENTIWGKNVSLVIYQIPEEKLDDINWTDEYQLKVLKEKYSQFVWVPVDLLDNDGTLDGENFTEKFGRRNYYQDDNFSPDEFNEPLKGILFDQAASIKKYKGFYISRYCISKDGNNMPFSVKGKKPWTGISFNEAKELSTIVERNSIVKSHLTYGAEYDSVLAWFIKTEARKLSEIDTDSTNWGNYWNSISSPRKIVPTGDNEKWCTNNIYDLAGNTDEWTQEMESKVYRVSRGGSYDYEGDCLPVAYRSLNKLSEINKETGFRVALLIK